jgi:hypothetical protein
MPTSDYSNTNRIARLRQIADLNGLTKVARALDNDTQLSIKLGGFINLMKTPSGLVSNCGICNVTPPPTQCIGTYPTGQFFGSAVCNGSTCYASNFPATTGPEVLAIPGTSYVLQSGVNLFMVNCSTSNVYWVNDYGTSTPQLILPGQAAITNPGSPSLVTYTFSS